MYQNTWVPFLIKLLFKSFFDKDQALKKVLICLAGINKIRCCFTDLTLKTSLLFSRCDYCLFENFLKIQNTLFYQSLTA